MQIGVTFPQTEIGADPAALRAYAQAVEGLGYQHLVVFDHVLGADPSHREGWQGYSHKQMFHEPMVLFGYLAALTQLELVTAVIILPQRQAALAAKQAVEIDILTGGKFRFGVGVGWNPVEYQALGMDFRTRGRALDEQIAVMRSLWSQEVINYQGRFHTIVEAGLNPLPIKRSIPIWIGGQSEAALKHIAQLGDGWFPQGTPDDSMRAVIEKLHAWTREAGRDPAVLGMEARISASSGTPDVWARLHEAWNKLGATHISLNTMGAGYTSLDQHIEALRQYAEIVK